MFPFDADCSYCRYLIPNDELNGKFYCEKKKQYISANGKLCSYAGEVMGRDNWYKAELRKISKAHGYYIITAITEILNLPEDNEYMETFKYLRDVIFSTNEEYQGFIADYEVEGPILADLIKKDANAQDYAAYLRTFYLNGMVSLFCQDRIDEALTLYKNMLDCIKEKYGYKKTSPKIKEYTNNEPNIVK